jgi:2,4-dienoyl-CoA reductase-like NADH-dependent reductase (Old Yellow Enzyme family)
MFDWEGWDLVAPAANRRDDEYGGSHINRMRFALEIAECVRANWPQENPFSRAFRVRTTLAGARNKASSWPAN